MKRLSSALLMVILAVGVVQVKADVAPAGELRVMRADYFQNYAGWFLSVEVFDDQVSADGSSGPAVSVAWRTATGSYGSDVDVPRYIDPVTSADPDVYLYNRTLVRIGAAPPAASPDPPVMIRVTSTSGAVVEAPVRPWLASAPPPHVAGYLSEFVTHYMDPTEVTSRFVSLAAQFPEIAEIVNLPEMTHGYRRKASTVMGVPAFAPYAGQISNLNNVEAQQAVILESKADGHEGGNNLVVTFRNPAAVNSALGVSMTGSELVVTLATDATGALSSTAEQIVAAINAYPAAAAAHGLPLPRARRHRHLAGDAALSAEGLPQRPGARATRAVPDEDPADRQASRWFQGRRLYLLPAAGA